MIRIRSCLSSPTAPSCPACARRARLHDPAAHAQSADEAARTAERTRAEVLAADGKARCAPKPGHLTRPPCRAATKFPRQPLHRPGKKQRLETIRRARELEAEAAASPGGAPTRSAAKSRPPANAPALPHLPAPPAAALPGRAGRDDRAICRSRAHLRPARRGQPRGRSRRRQRAAQDAERVCAPRCRRRRCPPRPPGRGRPRALRKAPARVRAGAGGKNKTCRKPAIEDPPADAQAGATQVVLAPRSTRVALQETDADPETPPERLASLPQESDTDPEPRRLASRPQETDADPAARQERRKSRYGPGTAPRPSNRPLATSHRAYRRSARHAQASASSRRSLPQNNSSPTRKLGAPNRPSSAARSV